MGSRADCRAGSCRSLLAPLRTVSRRHGPGDVGRRYPRCKLDCVLRGDRFIARDDPADPSSGTRQSGRGFGPSSLVLAYESARSGILDRPWSRHHHRLSLLHGLESPIPRRDLRAMKLGIVTDSTSDLPHYLIEQHELEVIPSILII